MRAPQDSPPVWKTTEPMNKPVKVVLIITVATVLALPLILNIWVSSLVAVLTVFALLTSWSWTLQVDSHGFSYWSPIRVPRSTIPYTKMREGKEVDVTPWEWGGWGWRLGAAGAGLIARSGAGIQITKSNGKILQVSCQNAATAVEMLKRHADSALD